MCQEMRRHVSVREDDGFAADGSDLRTADIEDIGQLRDVGEGHIRDLAHQTIAKSCPIQEERNLVFPADLVERRQLRLCIEGSQLGRM